MVKNAKETNLILGLWYMYEISSNDPATITTILEDYGNYLKENYKRHMTEYIIRLLN